MGYLQGAFLICLYISACSGNDVMPDTVSTQSTTTPQRINWPWKTTTTHRPTTTHTTQHTNHTTTPQTTLHTNHTTTPQTTLHTNHTTTPQTTLHTNHTTATQTTTHTNHTTPTQTTTHTNHTTPTQTTKHTNHTTSTQTTPHANHTTAPYANQTTPHHTTQQPTTAPPSGDFFVNSTTGVCLRIRASFKILLSNEMEIVIPPNTTSSGSCSAQGVELTLAFPKGKLSLTFRQNSTKGEFYLGAVNISLTETGSAHSGTFSNSSLFSMVAPLGHSFSCSKVNVEVASSVTFVATNVQAQAFNLPDGRFGSEVTCPEDKPNMTVPIIIGVILVVLVLAVVLAYVIARRRNHGGYQSL